MLSIDLHSALFLVSLLLIAGGFITLLYMLATRPRFSFHEMWSLASKGDRAARLYLWLVCSAFALALGGFVVARL